MSRISWEVRIELQRTGQQLKILNANGDTIIEYNEYPRNTEVIYSVLCFP